MIRRDDLRAYLDERLGRGVGSGDEVAYRCPTCDAATKRKLSVNVRKGVVHCWRCGYAASIRTFLRDLNGGHLGTRELSLLGRVSPPGRAIECRRYAISRLIPPSIPPASRGLEPEPLPPEYVPLAGARGARFRPAFAYLRRRGVGMGVVERFRVGYCTAGRCAHYLVFPVVQFGRQVYYTTRFTGRSPSRKSLNPKAVGGRHTKSSVLLNYDAVVGLPVVAIVEGPFDCMAYPESVAVMGRTVSDRQVELLSYLVGAGTREFVVLLDADAAVEADAMRARLSGVAPTVSVATLESGDPHDNRDRLDRVVAERGSGGLGGVVRSRVASVVGRGRRRLTTRR